MRIFAKDVMETNFPILDSSLPLIKCIEKLHKQGVCLIVKDGYFQGLLDGEDILRGLMYKKDKNSTIDKIKIKRNFEIVTSNSDIYETIGLMKERGVEFIVVKKGKNIMGVITKKEILDIEPLLFENLQREV